MTRHDRRACHLYRTLAPQLPLPAHVTAKVTPGVTFQNQKSHRPTRKPARILTFRPKVTLSNPRRPVPCLASDRLRARGMASPANPR